MDIHLNDAWKVIQSSTSKDPTGGRSTPGLDTVMATYFFSLLLLVRCVDCAHVPAEICRVYKCDEDIQIGGIFSIHEDLRVGDTVQPCGRLLPVSALQLTEAMAFAVDTINKEDTLLPGKSLGFTIHDDCSRDEYAMWNSLSFHMNAAPTMNERVCRIPGRREGGADSHMGIVGTGRSSSSEVVSKVAQLFQRPLVSYGSTEVRHQVQPNPSSFRFSTISSDHHKARAIVDVLAHFKWEHIAVVSDYVVRELLEEVERQVSERRLCMNVRVVVHEAPTQTELNMMVETLLLNPNAQVVLLLASAATTARTVLSAVSEVDPPFHRTWVVDSWGSELVRRGHSQNGISIEYDQPELVEFENYFRSRVSGNNTKYDNPWFEEFCTNSDICLKSSNKGFSKSLIKLAPTIDAVFALAHLLDKTIREYCIKTLYECLGKLNTDDALLKIMQNISFTGTRGHFRFINNSVTAQFIIKNRQEDDEGVPKLVKVGYWDPVAQDQNQLNLNSTLIQWIDGMIGSQPPRSSCKTKCLSNQVEHTFDECCSGCRNCSGIVNGNECTDCDKYKRPNENSTVCVHLDRKSVTWDDPFAIVLVSLTSLGLLLCGVTSYGMIRHRHHALIKAASRELSAVNIIGLVLAFVSVFPLLVPPSAGICGVAQSMYALSFTLMYAPLLLKVNRIYRIFESSSKTVKRPRFTGPISQLAIVAVLVTIQLVIIPISAFAHYTTADSVKTLWNEATESEPRHLEVCCDLGNNIFIAPMCYNIALLAACCYYAYKARNVPGNFNEARFYVASVYTTLLPFVAAVPLYFTARTAIVIQVSVSMIPITNGYVTLILVYLSKLYAIIFNKVGTRQDENEPATKPKRVGLSSFDDKKGPTSVGGGAANKVHPMASRVMNSDDVSQTNASRLNEGGL